MSTQRLPNKCHGLLVSAFLLASASAVLSSCGFAAMGTGSPIEPNSPESDTQTMDDDSERTGEDDDLSDGPPHEGEEPGETEQEGEQDEPAETWGNHDLSCNSDNDCLAHESCILAVCQVDRCSGGNYQSTAPLGDSYVFYADFEFGILDEESWAGEHWVDGYSPAGNAAQYASSWSAGSSEMTDVAGGNFLASGEEGYVVSLLGAPALAVLTGAVVTNFMLPFPAESIAAGDFNADGRDDVTVIDDSRLAVCDLAAHHCVERELAEGAEPQDVAMGDVDGDGRADVILLVEDGDRWLRILDDDSQFADEPAFLELPVDADAHKVTAADLDGDGRAEIIVLEEGGWFHINDDELTVYRVVDSPAGSPQLQQVHHTAAGYGRLLDVTAGDIDADDSAEIVVLDDHDKVAVFRYTGSSLERIYEQATPITQSGRRIAMADQDNNSPRASLSTGPTLEAGASVPIVAMLLPPYSYDYSAGFSSAGYGMGEIFSESYSDTVSLTINADVGVGGNFLGLFGASFSEKVGWKASETLGTTTSMATGGRSGIRSQPEDFGFHYGAVVVSWGCFHAYSYEIEDPDSLVPGSDGEQIVLTVPVDGGTAMLSTGRYNAIAQAVGDLPIIEAPYRVGDPTDYPREPETIYGEPIPEDAYVFPDLSWYEVSDVGYVGWFNTLGNSTTSASSYGMDMGASAKITVSGVSVGLGASAGWGRSYSLTLGDSAMFNGGIPPFRDDPLTPEDEYVENFFRVSPITYMQDYVDSAGNEAAFYVSTYVVDID